MHSSSLLVVTRRRLEVQSVKQLKANTVAEFCIFPMKYLERFQAFTLSCCRMVE